MKDLWSYKSLLVWIGAIGFVKFIFKPETPSIYVDIVIYICFYIIGRWFVDFVCEPIFKRYVENKEK